MVSSLLTSWGLSCGTLPAVEDRFPSECGGAVGMVVGSSASPPKNGSPRCRAVEMLMRGDALVCRDALRCHQVPGSHSITLAPTRVVGQPRPAGCRDPPHPHGRGKPFCNHRWEGSCSVGEICEELCLFKVPLGFWALNKHPGWGWGWRFSSWERRGGKGAAPVPQVCVHLLTRL